MKRIAITVIALATLAAPLAPCRAKGPSAGGPRGSGYDARTVETVTGEVVGVEHVAAGHGRSGGVHLTLKTDRETLDVHLGPAWYVDEQAVKIGRGDRVEAEGSRVSIDGKPVIIARQVKKGGDTLTLRNESGVPVWAGHGGRR